MAAVALSFCSVDSTPSWMQWLNRLFVRNHLQFLHSVAGFKMGLPNVVFVLGGPGAGKGTQCQKIVEVREVSALAG